MSLVSSNYYTDAKSKFNSRIFADVLSFQKKNAGQRATTSFQPENFHAPPACSRHLHNEFKNSFQGDVMDNSNKHC